MEGTGGIAITGKVLFAVLESTFTSASEATQAQQIEAAESSVTSAFNHGFEANSKRARRCDALMPVARVNLAAKYKHIVRLLKNTEWSLNITNLFWILLTSSRSSFTSIAKIQFEHIATINAFESVQEEFQDAVNTAEV